MRFVHDTGALLAGMPALVPGESYTTEDNLKEVKDSASRNSLSLYMSKLKVVEPKKELVELVKERARELGEDLSETDVKVLALALQVKGTILSDDYGVLNVAQSLGLKWRSVRTEGIKGSVKWEKYCPNCKKTYPPSYSECPVCGSVLIRRARKKK